MMVLTYATPVYLKPDDVMTLGIEKLGRQRQRVRSWSRT